MTYNMPKNQAKRKESEAGESYVPLITPKQTVEVAVKELPKVIEEVVSRISEKPAKSGKRGKKPKKFGRKTGGISDAKKERKSFGSPLVGNSILIITEKPQAASKIASALSDGKASQQKSAAGVYYYEFSKDNENIIVACAVGHLFSLSQDIKGSGYPIFEVSWKPNFEVRKKDFTKRYYDSIARLVNRAKEIIIATDYDIEGEVIGYNIIRFIASQNDAKRMKFSSLTKGEIEDAFRNASLTIDWGQAIAGETRHYLDWYYGINLSRALMAAIKSAGKFRIMSIGRVQGPALNLIVEKEMQIQAFKPVPFWKIFLDIVDKKNPDNALRVRHVKDIKNRKELDKFKYLEGKEAEVETKKTLQTIPPLAPFDLTALQTEAYKFFSIVPSRTLQIAQQLYLAGLISYPRTSSQKIPAAINPGAILKRLANFFPKAELATRSAPVEGGKSDPAHPSIYPTGEFQQLSGEEKKIYELIAKRFIACFCEDAKIENKTITATINGLKFSARALEIKNAGWMEVYEAKIDEKEIKDMNGKAEIVKVEIAEDETKPPKRFSPASLVSELEKKKLGTKSTRAAIIETLYDRNYIADTKSIKATPLGMHLIATLAKYSPIITDEKLTKNMEKEMEEMQTMNNKARLEEKQGHILNEAKNALVGISESFKKNEAEIGKEMVEATQDLWKQQKEENEIAECPACKKGMLAIKYSPKNRRYFIACNAYPECKTTFSLPPNGLIKKTGKTCDKCGFPLLMRISKGKRPWTFCFNQECESRKEGSFAVAKKDLAGQKEESEVKEEIENQKKQLGTAP